VSSEASAAILAGASRTASARVVVESGYVPAVAQNVVIAMRGSRRSFPPVVVMTPRSSWWQSAAERAAWEVVRRSSPTEDIEVAKAALANPDIGVTRIAQP